MDLGICLNHPLIDGTRPAARIADDCLIRPGAVIYCGVTILSGVKVGHHTMIREHARIGPDTVIGTAVTIEDNTVIGARCLIETQALITGRMVIEDDVFIGPGVITTNERDIRWNREGAREHLEGPHVCHGARIGAGAILLPGITIGANALIGAGSIVTRDVPENAIAMGNPARVVGEVPVKDRL